MMNKLRALLFIALFITPIASGKDYSVDTLERLTANKKIVEVRKTVSKLAPHLPFDRQSRVASAIYENSVKHRIPKKILLSIIKVESNFHSNKVSSTGDYSIVQINLKIWNKEFKRLGLKEIDKNKIVYSDNYAIDKMCQILNIIKSRSPKDSNWYIRYHSNTPEFNQIYKVKLDKVMRLMASR